MIWTLIAVTLLAWFIGLLLQSGRWSTCCWWWRRCCWWCSSSTSARATLASARILLMTSRRSLPCSGRHGHPAGAVAARLDRSFGGAFIHLLLVIAVIVLIYNLLAGRRTA